LGRAVILPALEGANLQTVTSKAVRQQIQEKLGVDLTSRRKEIDAIIMAEIKDQVSSDEAGSDEEVNVSTKRKAKGSDDDDYSPRATKKPAKKKTKKRKADSDDSDDDWGKKKKKSSGGGRKGNEAFKKSYKLSPELAEFLGEETMPRHEVVKKIWEHIKSNKLQDPSQKQFCICDEGLEKVIGVKRFKPFGMMKYLKTHFIEAA